LNDCTSKRTPPLAREAVDQPACRREDDPDVAPESQTLINATHWTVIVSDPRSGLTHEEFALVAGLGIAVGAAWGGLLSNFAAGEFILVLRPFKVGDYAVAGDVEGSVRSIGLFSTSIDRPDNLLTLVGNAKVMNGMARSRILATTHSGASIFRRSSTTASMRQTRSDA
jgi:mechanosensitive ion channel-like protein